jgi:hypothetical protein
VYYVSHISHKHFQRCNVCSWDRRALDAFATEYYAIRHVLPRACRSFITATRHLNVALRQMWYSEVCQNLCANSYFVQNQTETAGALQLNRGGSTAATYFGGPWFKFLSTDELRLTGGVTSTHTLSPSHKTKQKQKSTPPLPQILSRRCAWTT